MNNTSSAEIEKCYQNFWRDLIECEDGSLNIEQVKLELYDYYQAIQNVTKVYDEITCGKFTKINTDPQVIIEAAEQFFTKSDNPVDLICLFEDSE